MTDEQTEGSFDQGVLVERTEADKDLMRMLADVFEADRPRLLGAFEAALEAGDADASCRAAHTIKGAVAVFGAERARALAERLEHLGREGDVDEVRRLYPELKARVITFETELRSFVDRLV